MGNSSDVNDMIDEVIEDKVGEKIGYELKLLQTTQALHGNTSISIPENLKELVEKLRNIHK